MRLMYLRSARKSQSSFELLHKLLQQHLLVHVPRLLCRPQLLLLLIHNSHQYIYYYYYYYHYHYYYYYYYYYYYPKCILRDTASKH